MGTVLEEADETGYWIELLADSGKAERETAAPLLTESGELVAISISSINTARRNSEAKPECENMGPGGILHCALCILRSIPPARAISTKNKHLLAIYGKPTRGFTAVVSVFWGTPPAKPLDCKIRPDSSGALRCDPRARPASGEPRLSDAVSYLVPGDIF
jgi:hypothetical protein